MSKQPDDLNLLQPPTSNLKFRLCVMMFLQYFVQGCYLPIVSVYLEEALGFTAGQIGMFGSALAIGPLVAPFIIGQLVDRRFATQHVLLVCHLAGGATMLALYMQHSFWAVVILGTIYSVLYVPSMMLTNSLAFSHLENRDRDFPLVRMWGTIGFIVPAWLIEMVFLRNVQADAINDARGIALATAGVAGIVMAAYCLLLPHTPPARRDEKTFAPAVVVGLMRQWRFFVLVSVSFLVAIVHKFFFVLNSPYLKVMLQKGNVESAWEGRISSLGQVAEIGVMAGLGLLIVRLGFKRTMLIGALAYMVRCLILGGAYLLDAPFAVTISVVCLGQLLHGLCFGCFMASAFIYIDRYTPTDIRGSAQNIYGTFVLGIGFFAGGFVSGWIGDFFNAGTKGAPDYNWTAIWFSGAALAAVCLVTFGLLFPRDPPKTDDGDEETP